MTNQDRTIAKIGKVQVYRRGGDTCFLKWYDGTRGKSGNYRRRSTRTTELSRAVALATALHEALESGLDSPERIALGPTLIEAATAHPATRREKEKYPGDHKRHMDALKDYVKFAKSPLLRDLTVEKTTTWAESLEEQGYAFDMQSWNSETGVTLICSQSLKSAEMRLSSSKSWRTLVLELN